MATDCIVSWTGGLQTVKGAELGDERVAELLNRLAMLRAQNVRLDFVDASPEPQPAEHK